ncbi:MAG: zinc ABC transporter substrate-binding protein [Spirochaetaceae bacterium]|nr:zinc ABC transporter substrate-binding protein [Spirochaetaceae bacterium]
MNIHDRPRRRAAKPFAAAASMLLVAAAVLSAAACAPRKALPRAEEQAALSVVASFYPMYVIARNVIGDAPGVTLRNMAGIQTGCLHDYSLTAADMKTLEGADIFVVNGGGMESFLEKAAAGFPKLKTIQASEGIPLIEGGEGPNPHVFVSPFGAAAQTRNVAKALAELDPSRAAVYARNGEAYAASLEALGAKMKSRIAQLPNRSVVTFHEAFPYFAEAFGLEIAAVVEREPGSEPSAGELADTIGIVRKSGVKALFAEPQYSKASAEVIARETGAKLFTLDPCVTGPDEPGAYLAAMEKNLATLEEALR